MNWWLSLWAAPAALGFAVFFNVRRRALVPIALLAVAAHLLRSLLQEQGWHAVAASFAAALLVGVVAYLLGPATGEATPVYGFAPVIPLIPGTLMFDGFRDLAAAVTSAAPGRAEPLLSIALLDLFSAGAVILALVLGAIAPMLFVPGRARDAGSGL